MSFVRNVLVAVVLLGMCSTWVVMSETLTDMQVGFKKPFFITFVVRAGYIILLPVGVISAVYRVYTGRAKFTWREMVCCGRDTGRWAYGSGPESVAGPPPLYASPLSHILLLGALLGYVVCAGGYFWYLSLPYTSIPANNTIFQSVSALVFPLSWMFLGERATVQKFVAVGISILGVVLIALGGTSSDATDTHPEAFGYIMDVVAVFCYAIFEVIYARYGEPVHACVGAPGVHGHEDEDEDEEMGEEEGDPCMGDALIGDEAWDGDKGSRGESHASSAAIASPTADGLTIPMAEAIKRLGAWGHPATDLWSQAELSALMMGLVGLFTLLIVWPVLPILNVTGIEVLEWPLPEGKWGMLAFNAVLDTAYNGLLLLGVLVSSPLIISVGTMLVIPASMVVDGIINNTRFHFLAYIGVVGILVGFIVLKTPPSLFRRCPCCHGAAVKSADTKEGNSKALLTGDA